MAITKRKQQVAIIGITSRWVSVKSGVPQKTVLDPLMFLLYINDIGENVLSKLKLLADDCILHKAISSIEDCHEIQNDLNTIYQCSQKWMCRLKMVQIYFIYSNPLPSY